ncbi:MULTISPECIES: sigma factor-like helix-turn-helix DNA-binding protein [unclassified Streptomyces]|uniref:sigma factor-like helix-turn-helix DNA-binding protein n=1 Tax=unclassified Streptomyces TaxID=2593676 RepID=UPI002278A3B9|nr:MULTISPECIES: sigma factor-like helix-turn-helix DNA-binding protein [unclassified Streptomyces]WKX22733.1 sigma factor-like helix-turn-helix DNA-binding protein [Streptomyces sp. HUAS CX7]
MSDREPPTGPPGRADDVFARQGARLFRIAYGMLGSAAQAEDVVRDVREHWQTTDRAVVADPRAYLTTATTRLSIRAAYSARLRRASYIGPWLPEPLDTDNDGTAGAGTEPVEFDVLLMLEQLDLAERAAFVLRETLACPYSEVAAVLGIDEARARHLVHRARRHLATGRVADLATDRVTDRQGRDDTADQTREDDGAEDYEAA